jgi:hypothetical protein
MKPYVIKKFYFIPGITGLQKYKDKKIDLETLFSEYNRLAYDPFCCWQFFARGKDPWSVAWIDSKDSFMSLKANLNNYNLDFGNSNKVNLFSLKELVELNRIFKGKMK